MCCSDRTTLGYSALEDFYYLVVAGITFQSNNQHN